MTPFSHHSPEDLRNTTPIQLGCGGFCFLVCELLIIIFPSAELWRLTDENSTRFVHVFLKVDDRPLDIKGFRDVNHMRFDFSDQNTIPERTTKQSVCDYFYPKYTVEQMVAAKQVLQEYIDENPVLFERDAVV